MLKLVVFLAALATLSISVNAKVFSLCELVRELRKQGFPEHQLRDWVCLVQHESSMKTQAVGPPNSDSSLDYGLFQINNRYWCSDGKTPGKECNITCKQLLKDDITIASKCAKTIFDVHGFSAWNAWKDHCQGALPDISHCN